MTIRNKHRIVAFAAILPPAFLAQSALGQAVAAAAASTTATKEEEVVVLSPFEVTADSDKGYSATQTLAGSRINTRLEDVGSAITVVTSEFLKDTGATDNKTLLAYTTNTEVGGTQGNFKGISGGKTEDEGGRLVSPNGNTRVRGLASADNTRNFFTSDIPWDGYNVDRVDMQRGANSILFGLGSPAGIINAGTKSAQHRTFGSIELRYGSFGANRVAIDYNQELLDDELSVRIDLLRNDEQFKQQPAYSLDRRMFGTLRYDPKFLSRGGARTSLKVNFENGTIRSNNPRTITPTDQFTTWWTKINKAGYDPNRVQNSGYFYQLDANGSPTYGADGKQTGGYYPTDAGQYNVGKFNTQVWLGQPSFFGGIWMPVTEDTTTPSMFLQAEYANIGGLRSNGTIDGSIGGLPFSRRVTMATTTYMAERDATVPYRDQGVWKATTLSDPSVFDFYNNLLEGDNKSESQNFKNFNAALTQTFFREKVGFEAAYSYEDYNRKQFSFGNTLFVDINTHLIGGAVNPNFGKAYVEGGNTWGNGRTSNTRESSRLSAFATHDFNEGGQKGWLWKLLGKHTLSGLYSQDMLRTESRSFKRYGTDDVFTSFVSLNPVAGVLSSYGMNSNERAASTSIYLTSTLKDEASPFGLYVPRAGGAIQMPSSASFRYFDSTWKSSVNPADPWTSTYNGEALTQSENPANYAGWKTTSVNILSAENGDEKALTFGASLDRRKVDSRAVVLQSFFWDGAIVGMYGIRHDNVKSWAATGYVPTTWPSRDHVDFGYVIPAGKVDAGLQQFSTIGRTYQLTRANSPSWSVVGKLNKFFGKYGESFPVNLSLFYSESRNFQVSGTRNDIHGNPLPPPSGRTNDRGLMLSTKDERFSLKINKYKTTVLNASNTSLTTWFLLGDYIVRNENRADSYQYHLTKVGDPNSVADTGTVTGTDVWRYAPRTINGVTETQDQADAVAAAAIAAWRQYTNEPLVKQILGEWGFNDFSGIAPTIASTPVANFTATEDRVSTGWEYEFTANPTKSWRITFNASDTKAQRNNVGGEALREFVELTNHYQNKTAMGDIRQWGGGQTTPLHPGLNSWNTNFYQSYALMRLQEGTNTPEIRRWRFNVVTNYGFSTGRLKGFNVGGGYRWEDKIAIGYPMKTNDDGSIGFDVENPYYGPTAGHVDLWLGYERKLTAKLDWRVQFNLRNAFDSNHLIPLSTQYDGTVAAWGIGPVRSWTLTNTFSF